MCAIFINTDPHLYVSRTRSVRLHGAVTSIRLENLFWEVLTEIATRDKLTLVQLIETLYDELSEARETVSNFASFLRVSALRYMALQAYRGVPMDATVPIRSLNPDAALSSLPPHWQRAGQDEQAEIRESTGTAPSRKPSPGNRSSRT
ncbi:ribbon-helix-helix domain-containing protein [Hydrogenophaga sp. 5NK40-0174]|uniref:ribbon-helix-helix domain-containing protein n=1 Tax=Hydrogenophaga sp. 5NK40-0174 TaxID=3127649 RepID=UPI0031084FB8